MLKLGTQVRNKLTRQEGTLTLLQIETNGNEYYAFQPKAINPKDGLPVAAKWYVESDFEGGVHVDGPNIPEGLLGSEATDSASGLKGKVSSVRLHINGCFHASIQSDRILPETGTVPDAYDVDIRRLVGSKVPVYTEKSLEESREKNPSPEGVKPYSPRI